MFSPLKILTTTITPAKDKVNVKKIMTTDKMLILETQTRNDIEKIQNNDKLKTYNLKIETPRKRLPLIIIYDIQAAQTEEELTDAIFRGYNGQTDI